MRKHVSVEFVLLWKGLLAEGALVRPVSPMNSLVILEVRALDETPVAEGALVRPDARDAGVVVTFALLVAEDLTARVALVPLRIAQHCRYVTTIATLGALVPLRRFFIELLLCLTILGEMRV